MESDGRRALQQLHCMKCGSVLTTRTTSVPLHHIPAALLVPAATATSSSDTQGTGANESSSGKPKRPTRKPKDYTSITRQVCSREGCDWIYYNNPLPIVAAIVEYVGESKPSTTTNSSSSASPSPPPPSSRQFILVQNKGWPSTWFGLVTGFLENREDPSIGVLREVKEELGLEAEIKSFVGLYPFTRINQLIIAYHVQAYGKIRLQEEEIAAYKFITLDKLRPWPAGTGKAVADFVEKETGVRAPIDYSAFQRPQKAKL